MYQMAIKYTNIFPCKNLKNIPKLGFSVWNYAIWQPCSGARFETLVTFFSFDSEIKFIVQICKKVKRSIASLMHWIESRGTGCFRQRNRPKCSPNSSCQRNRPILFCQN
jgi:hypothetical protein